jgi:hypothetical protein
MFGSLRLAIDSLSPNASHQEISKLFIQVIEQVYSRQVMDSPYLGKRVALQDGSTLAQVNEFANDMIRKVFEANNKYLQEIYAQINTQSSDISSIMHRHRNAIIEAIEQHHLEVLAIVGVSNSELLKRLTK